MLVSYKVEPARMYIASSCYTSLAQSNAIGRAKSRNSRGSNSVTDGQKD